MKMKYTRPPWCHKDTWQRAKELVETLIPSSLMDRTGQRRIEIAAKALQDEATAKTQFEVKVLSGALAGMLDVWSGYPIPECDAAISAMQFIGVDRWSAQASLEKEMSNEIR